MIKPRLIMIGCILIMPVTALLITNQIMWWQLDAGCIGRLKRAADANTVEMAAKELSAAVNYAEETGLMSGYTSILYRTPDEDVGFWYQNINGALAELKALPTDVSHMERTNVLMKLRETLLDSSEGKEVVTRPDGLVRFPNNKLWALGYILSIALSCLGFACVVSGLDK